MLKEEGEKVTHNQSVGMERRGTRGKKTKDW